MYCLHHHFHQFRVVIPRASLSYFFHLQKGNFVPFLVGHRSCWIDQGVMEIMYIKKVWFLFNWDLPFTFPECEAVFTPSYEWLCKEKSGRWHGASRTPRYFVAILRRTNHCPTENFHWFRSLYLCTRKTNQIWVRRKKTKVWRVDTNIKIVYADFHHSWCK